MSVLALALPRWLTSLLGARPDPASLRTAVLENLRSCRASCPELIAIDLKVDASLVEDACRALKDAGMIRPCSEQLERAYTTDEMGNRYVPSLYVRYELLAS